MVRSSVMGVVDHIDGTEADDLDETSPDVSVASLGPGPVVVDDPAPRDLGPRLPQLGRYVLLREIGAGAIGVVYAAYHEGLDRRLAIKLLNRQRAGRADLEARLRREAKALAKLSHPNVVQVYDVGEFDGRVFVAMEFVEGETLTEWLRGDRSLSDKLAMFAAAGRGLAAAHDAGVVHRDFKPDNVLVGRDGRPRVLDFGLARAAEPSLAVRPAVAQAPARLVDAAIDSDNPATFDPDLTEAAPDVAKTHVFEPEPGAEGLVDELVTRDGALLGTPAYMSPEQFFGHRVDRESDQFSFCVALYEALYKQRPFAGKSTLELAVQTQDGLIVDPPPNTDVPARLRQILVRGLSPQPEHRYPSMDALLAELERDPDQRRRGRWVVGAGVAAIATIALTFAALEPAAAPACPAVDPIADELWASAAPDQIAGAFARSELGYADAAWATAALRLRGWTRTWAEHRVDACEATHVRKEFSAEVLDRRQACLERGRRAFNALAEQFASGEPAVIERAVEASAALPDPSRCSDIDSLLTQLAAPSESVAVEVGDVRDQLAEVEALTNTGSWTRGLALGRDALDRARASEYGPVVAEALLAQGRLLAESRTTTEAGDDARSTLEAALDQAERSGHDQLIPQIATELVSLSIYTRPDPVRGRLWARRAIAALDRIDERGLARARGLRALGNIERLDGEYTQAEAHLRQALASFEEQHAEDHPDYAILLNDLGNTLEARGQLDAAEQTFERALSQSTLAFGTTHPRVGHAHYNLARIAFARGQFALARSHRDRAQHIYVEAHGEQHRDVGSVWVLSANIALAEGDVGEAERYAGQAKSIYDAALAPDNIDRAEPNLLLGHVAFARGELDAALEHYRDGLATQRAALPPGHIGLVSSLTNLGLVQLNRGQVDAAIDHLDEARALLEAGEQVNPDELRMNRQYLADALSTRASAADLDRAITQLERAFEGCTDSPMCADLALQAARTEDRRHDHSEAVRWARVARPLFLALDPEAHPDQPAALAELDAWSNDEPNDEPDDP